MFNKITSFSIDRNNVEILDNELVKTASEIVLPEGHEYDPDFVYMKVRAVSAGEYWGCNKNADFFPEEELKKNYKTFFDAHVFKNHENKEVEKAIGDVLDAVWNDEMKYVELFIRVDKRIAPTIARGFEKGFMTDVSMGCKIDYSICSICGNSAKTQSQYCDHIKYEKHKVRDDGKKVYEININPRFHDISAVLNGADRTAKMTGLFISGTKVAYHEEETMEKCASTLADALFDEPVNRNTLYTRPQKSNEYTENVDSLTIFDKKASENVVSKKASELEKIAEIKKRIKGNVLAVAQSRAELAEKERINAAVDAVRTGGNIRPLKEDVLDRFAEGINRLSDSEEVMAEQVLTTALKMLSLAGVNLSPAEFSHIMRKIIGIPQRRPVRVCPHNVRVPELMRRYDNGVAESMRIMRGTNMPTIFNVMRSLAGKSLPVVEGHRASVPATIVIRKVASCDGIVRPEVPGLNLEEKCIKLASEIIEERSMHLPHMTKRAMAFEAEMEKEAEEGVAEVKGSMLDHYYDFIVQTPVEKVASEDVFEEIERQAYGVYQNLAADYVESRELNGDLYRFANEIGVDTESMEKCAKNLMKAVNAGAGTLFYGKYQNVKAREGRPQSTINRTIGENPELTAFGAAVATKAVLDRKEAMKQASKKASKKALRYMAKHADENMDIYLDKDIFEGEDVLEDIDIFKDSVINTKMAMEYTPKQIDLIKTASVMYAQGRQDLCDNLLSIEGLGYDSINNFLQICEDTLFEELEKKASIGAVVGKLAGKATKAIGTMATKAAPMAQKAMSGVKSVGQQVGSAISANATPGMKAMGSKIQKGFNNVKKDIGSLDTAGKIGVGASVVGTGLGLKNAIDNKRKFNEMHKATTQMQPPQSPQM